MPSHTKKERAKKSKLARGAGKVSPMEKVPGKKGASKDSKPKIKKKETVKKAVKRLTKPGAPAGKPKGKSTGGGRVGAVVGGVLAIGAAIGSMLSSNKSKSTKTKASSTSTISPPIMQDGFKPKSKFGKPPKKPSRVAPKLKEMGNVKAVSKGTLLKKAATGKPTNLTKPLNVSSASAPSAPKPKNQGAGVKEFTKANPFGDSNIPAGVRRAEFVAATHKKKTGKKK